MRSFLTKSVVACAALPLVAAMQSGEDDPGQALRVGTLLVGDGSIHEDALLWIRDGKVVDFGSDLKLPPGVDVIERPNLTACAGFVDAQVATGGGNELGEGKEPFRPDARAVDAWNPASDEWDELLRAGVTTALLAPDRDSPVGGLACAVKTGGDDRIVSRGAYQTMSFSKSAFRGDRKPTSLMGALREVRARLEGGDGEWGVMARGRRALVVSCEADAEARAAARLATDYAGARVFVAQAYRADRAIPQLKKAGVGVVLGPFSSTVSPRNARIGGLLEEAGIATAFASHHPSHDATTARFTAAVAVRGGMSPATGQAGLGRVPAEWFGIDDRVGTLRKGRDADIVLLTGDPIDLGSRIEEVWIDGAPAWVREEAGE